MARRTALVAALLLVSMASALAIRVTPEQVMTSGEDLSNKGGKEEKEFTSPAGLFIQERASKQLPGPGQHFSFGALVGWEQVHQILTENKDAKLLLLVRHGQAISNYLSDFLGPDEWFKQEDKCSYTDPATETTYKLFDAELTGLGEDQARSLNSMLNGAGWYAKLTGSRPTRSIVSPLSRCLHTALLVTEGLVSPSNFTVEENVRETLGEDTCDARRSVSDPTSPTTGLVGPCDFDQGLTSKFPMFKYGIAEYGLGIKSDKDKMWTKDRETQKHQIQRATTFLRDVFDAVEEQVVMVVTHSGFTRSVLLAVDREPYRPQNTELVPVVVIDNSRRRRQQQQQQQQ